MNTQNTRRGFTQNHNVILNRGHYLWAASRKVVIRDLIKLFQDLQRLPLPLLNNRRGRFQIKFGMTPLFNHNAFTLIELLVVVLIIGILAAVAVPQYQVTVMKSKVASMQSGVKAIATAAELYHLANGEYPYDDVRELDISEFSGCTTAGAGQIRCGLICYDLTTFTTSTTGDVVGKLMKDDKEGGCTNEDTRIIYRQKLPLSTNTRECWALDGTVLSRKVCLAFGGRALNGSTTVYKLP